MNDRLGTRPFHFYAAFLFFFTFATSKGLSFTLKSFGTVSAIYHLFPMLQKSHDLIFIYSPGIRDFYQYSSAQDIIVER